MKTDIKYLSQNITKDVAGLIWLTDKAISHDTPLLFEVNYLLDGNLLKSIEKNSTPAKKTFLLGQSFGAPFFVAHTVFTSVTDLKSIYEQIRIAMNAFDEMKKSVYIVNKSQYTSGINLEKELTNRFQELSFEHLNI